MQVSVVNSYAAASDSVPVSNVRSDDLPTEGKPGGPAMAFIYFMERGAMGR